MSQIDVYRENVRRAVKAAETVLTIKGVIGRRDRREPGRLEKELAEARLMRLFRRVWRKHEQRILLSLAMVKATPAPPLPPIDLSWDDEDEWELIDELTKAVRGGISLAGFRQIRPDLVNIKALEYARKYAGQLIKELDRTTLEIVRAAISAFIETPGMTIGDLKNMLPFGEQRADTIAVTEVTRAYAEGNRVAGREMAKEFPGVPVVKTWFTNNDDLVCDICGPLEGMTVLQDEGFSTEEGEGLDGPPAHPNCRCWISYRTDITRLDNGG